MAKFLFLFVFVASLQVSAALHAQNKMVSLQMKGASLEEVIQVLKFQTDFGFFYNIDNAEIQKVKGIDIDMQNALLDDVLEQVLRGTDLVYTIVNNVVIIKLQTRSNPQEQKKGVTVTGKVVDEGKAPLPGVSVVIKGTKVGVATDVNGQFKIMIPQTEGVSLVFSFMGMRTKEVKCADCPKNGEWVITLEEDVQTMDEVTVVSTGYQDIDRRRLTSAVTTLKMDDIQVAGLSSVDKMLEGHVPGMIFMQNSGQAGAAPKLRIRGTSTVLGNQEPLWVVDGIVQNDPVKVDPAQINDLDFVNLLGNAISGLNPDDIEQIDVLKDAAATAIYGVRAANGVIVITTKKGKVGKPHVTYSFSGTVNRRPYYSDREIYLMNSKERVDVSREMFERGMDFKNATNWYGYEAAYMDYKAGALSFDEFEKQTNFYETINTDWFDILCENSFSNKHTLSMSGGSDAMRYYASIGYNDERGVIKKEMNRNYTANLKLNGFFNKVTFQFGMQMSNNKRKYTPTTNGINITQYAYQMSRAIPAYNPDGSRWFYLKGSTKDLSYPFNMENEMDKTYHDINTYSVSVTGSLKYRILPVLTVEGTASYTLGSTNDETTYEEESWYVYDLRKNADNLNKCPVGGELNLKDNRRNGYMFRLQLNYNQVFADVHTMNVSLGGEVSSSQYHSFSEIRRGYYPERGKSFGALTGALLYSKYGNYRNWLATNKPTIGDARTNLASAYLAITYTYNNRYTLNFNTRMDASNQFGSRSNEKLLPIWSVSGRWDIKQDFFKESNFVNSLALKLSYGHQGNMLDNQTSKMIIQKGDLDGFYQEFKSTIAYYPNPDLKWELTSSYNGELEFSLWKNKLRATVGYYYKHTTDAFLTKKVSEINGVDSYVVNKGDISNRGLELSLSFTPINQNVDASGKRGFVWRFDPQIGQVVNKLISKAINNRNNTLRDKVTYNDYLNGSVELRNKPLNTFYSYRFKGLSPEDGHPVFYGTEEELKDELFEKYKGMTDEEVWEAVLVESGTRVPTLQGGISNYFGYRQFGLSFNFAYSFGNKIRLLKLTDNNNIRPYGERNVRREFVRRWRRPGDELKTDIPGLVASDNINTSWWNKSPYNATGAMTQFAGNDVYAMYDFSDLRVVRGDYLKLQSISFRYNVHDSFCKRLGIQSAYLSVTGTNIFTIASKKLEGQDVTQSGAAPTINMSLRPNYSFTLNVTF